MSASVAGTLVSHAFKQPFTSTYFHLATSLAHSRDVSWTSVSRLVKLCPILVAVRGRSGESTYVIDQRGRQAFIAVGRFLLLSGGRFIDKILPLFMQCLQIIPSLAPSSTNEEFAFAIVDTLLSVIVDSSEQIDDGSDVIDSVVRTLETISNHYSASLSSHSAHVENNISLLQGVLRAFAKSDLPLHDQAYSVRLTTIVSSLLKPSIRRKHSSTSSKSGGANRSGSHSLPTSLEVLLLGVLHNGLPAPPPSSAPSSSSAFTPPKNMLNRSRHSLLSRVPTFSPPNSSNSNGASAPPSAKDPASSTLTSTISEVGVSPDGLHSDDLTFDLSAHHHPSPSPRSRASVPVIKSTLATYPTPASSSSPPPPPPPPWPCF